ncbi:bacterial leucyl aminopeptidase [Flavobacteriaceae bacterium 3519-10]|nr:bacterial leucyl aminopeptidase [Flavobacteriaceae bacterium 3519-10]
MKKLLLLSSLTFSLFFTAQTFTQAYQNRVNQIAQTNINTYLTEFAAFGVKTTGSANNNNTFNWLKNKYLSFGYTADQLSENAFTYNGNTTKNLILTKTGTKYPDTFVIVCGHYDTIGGPGVNDNGSGTAILLEMARILKYVPTEYSVKFINFTGEEQGLLGSQKYVSSVVNSTSPKMKIKLVLNIDQVGGVAGEVNNTVTCEQDTNNSPATNNAASAAATQQLMACVGLYSPLQTNLSYAYGSDYMPFQSNGEVITGLYEYNESNTPHTSGDTYVNMDPVFVFNVAKGALGAVQHFAVADSVILSTSDSGISSYRVYPNPASDYLHIESNEDRFELSLADTSGKIVLRNKNVKKINVSHLPSGLYFASLNFDGQLATSKIIIAR